LNQLIRWLGRLRPRRLGLRARITIAFTVGAMVLSALLAGTTYALARNNLLNQRESTVLSRTYVNANLVRQGLEGGLTTDQSILSTLLPSLQTPAGSRPLLFYRGHWYSVTAEIGQDAVPQGLRDVVAQGKPARMSFVLKGQPAIGVGIPLASVDAQYFELAELQDLGNTLESRGLAVVGEPPCPAAAGRCEPGGRGDRRRPPRHAARGHAGPRPRHPGHVVQRHGARAAGSHRA
jgi:hypothetical protein